MEFEILMIHAGWFVLRFGDARIWASNWCLQDGPRQLLKLLTELINGEREAGCATFEAEPGMSLSSGIPKQAAPNGILPARMAVGFCRSFPCI